MYTVGDTGTEPFAIPVLVVPFENAGGPIGTAASAPAQ
jgi:hypothetical protein